jgi:signal transduction histidine kinase
MLVHHGGVAVHGTPADLLARRAIGQVLEGAGRVAELEAHAASLASDLAAGRWLLDRPAWELAARDIQKWTGWSASRERVALSVAVEWVVEQAGGRLHGTGHRLVTLEGAPITVLWREGADGLRALAIPPSLLDAWVESTSGQADGAVVRIGMLDDAGQAIAGVNTGGTPRIIRSSVETRLPWTLVFTPAGPDLADGELATRRSLLTAGLIALVALLVGGSYLLWRVVQRELAVGRLQTDFVAAVSHEFRTPLTALRHIVELLQESDEMPVARRQSFYSVLVHSTERLHRLVESLLDFSRMEHGSKPWDMREVDIQELVGRAVVEFRREHAAAALVFGTSAPEIVRADPDGLGNAVWNLLDNATKYSPAGGEIHVTVRPSGGGVAISIADQGLGIPRSEQRNVFRKFVRGGTAARLGIKGTGLGLAIVEQTVRAHNGRIEVESQVGKGSTFTIWLPAVAAQRAAADAGSSVHAPNTDR